MIQTFLRSTKVKLAASYLAIIMVLSTGFSTVLYHTSYKAIGRQIPPPTFFNDTLTDNSDFKDFFHTRITEGRHDLLFRLILLNVLALIAGAALSYYLAQRTLKPIEEAMDAQVRFSSDASHELRTPLTAIRARNEVALRKQKLSSTESRAVIKSNLDEILKLEKLTDGLLRLSRKNDIKKTTVSLDTVANEAMNLVMEVAQSKSIQIDQELPPIKVMADSQSLIQVATILLDNAIKYSTEGTTIKITGRKTAKDGILSIQDQGVGIRASDLPHIFERFYRVDNSRTKTGENGYGLGLSIAKKIVDQHSGEISVQSGSGVGSTFLVKIPLKKS